MFVSFHKFSDFNLMITVNDLYNLITNLHDKEKLIRVEKILKSTLVTSDVFAHNKCCNWVHLSFSPTLLVQLILFIIKRYIFILSKIVKHLSSIFKFLVICFHRVNGLYVNHVNY